MGSIFASTQPTPCKIWLCLSLQRTLFRPLHLKAMQYYIHIKNRDFSAHHSESLTIDKLICIWGFWSTKLLEIFVSLFRQVLIRLLEQGKFWSCSSSCSGALRYPVIAPAPEQIKRAAQLRLQLRDYSDWYSVLVLRCHFSPPTVFINKNKL